MQMTSRKPPLSYQRPLYLVQDLLLELPLDLLTRLIGVRLAVEVQEGAEVELGCLQQLDFADVDLWTVSKMAPEILQVTQRTFCNG